MNYSIFYGTINISFFFNNTDREKKSIKALKHFKAAIALILVAVMALLTPVNAFGASETGKYVSEVYVAYGKNAAEAEQTLKNKGFTPVEGNLNEGGSTFSMLGYKTTTEIRDSITDLAVMNMSGGYSVENYQAFLKSQKSDIVEFLEEFMTVIQEYRGNLKKRQVKSDHGARFVKHLCGR